MRCTVGVDNDDAYATKRYHDFLVWEMTRRPRWTRVLEDLANPVLGRSLIIYSTLPAESVGRAEVSDAAA